MSDPENVDGAPEEQEGLHISDKRRFDPETYQRRQASGPADAPSAATPSGDEVVEEVEEEEEGEVPGDFVVPDDLSELETDPRVVELETHVRERTEDLQRLQAEYVNYKRRVDRDRDLSRQGGSRP